MVVAPKSTRIKALCGLIFGILWLTPDSVLVRLYSCSVITQLMYKNLFFSLMCIPLVAVEKKGFQKGWHATREAGGWTLVQGVVFTVTQYCFTFSITNTAAATTLVLLASSPLFSAAIGRIFLKEPLKLSTALAMVGGAIGIMIVFVGNLSDSSTNQAHSPPTISNTTSNTTTPASDLSPQNEALGITLGLFTAISLAVYLNIQRYTSQIRPNASETAGLVLVGPICCVIGLIAGAQHIAQPIDLFWAFLQGGVVGPIAFGAFALAPRYLLASEVGLVQLLETVVGPIWVYLGGYETPPLETVWGGLVLLVTLAAYFIKELCWDDEVTAEEEEGMDENKKKKEKFKDSRTMDMESTTESLEIIIKEEKKMNEGTAIS